MDTRKVSTAVGFIILMGCIVAVVIVIYNGGSVRTSYKSSLEESWKKREMRIAKEKERKDLFSFVPAVPSSSEPSIQEAKVLADELQKLFMNTANSPGGGNVIKVNGGEGRDREAESGPKITFGSSFDSSSGNGVTVTSLSSNPSMPKSPPGAGAMSQTEARNRTAFSSKHSTTTTTFSGYSQDEQRDVEWDGNAKKIIPVESTPLTGETTSGNSGSRHQHQQHHKSVQKEASEHSSINPGLGKIKIVHESQNQNQNQNHESSMTAGTNRNKNDRLAIIQSSLPSSQDSRQPSVSMSTHHSQHPHSHLHHSHSRPQSSIGNSGIKLAFDVKPSTSTTTTNRREWESISPYFSGNKGAETGAGAKGPQDWDDMDYDDLLDDYEQQYLLEDPVQLPTKDPLKAMGDIVQLVTDVYKKGAQALDISGFLKVINETVQVGNNGRLLSQLNQLYKRPGNLSALLFPDSQAAVGRNAFESSLSAFAFMSFGIFLLNQIHNYMGTEKPDGNMRQGRNFLSNHLDLDESQSFELDFLFEPPLPGPTSPLDMQTVASESTTLNITGNANSSIPMTFPSSSSSATSTSTDITIHPVAGDKNNDHGNKGVPNETRRVHTADANPGSASREPLSTSDYVDNMFRAALNLVNAYTKDTQALECIWSKYCHDLDKTASQRGSLYSLAARINSIGLRLIMGQIPTELTVDVMLRSLLGWDGLPCSKMFSECKISDGSLKLVEEFEANINRTRT